MMEEMGLQGMINDLVKKSDFLLGDKLNGNINEIKEKILMLFHV